MNIKAKGVIYGAIAAISYGTNPLGALFLYEQGINANSVLFYRFLLAAVVLAGIMLVSKKSFAVSQKELLVLAGLGLLFGVSSITFFSSFHYMDAGIAATLLFVYPVMVAVIMALFFKERVSLITLLSIVLALGGIGLLYKSDAGMTLSAAGVMLVMLSSLTYALYIIAVNKFASHMSSLRLTFYALLFCLLTIAAHSFTDQSRHLQMLTTPSMWMWAVMLALVPTIISLITMAKAVQIIGSTPTAIMGALEPLTAVTVGVMIFGELFTMRLATGIALILISVTLIILGKSFSLSKLASAFDRFGGLMSKIRHKKNPQTATYAQENNAQTLNDNGIYSNHPAGLPHNHNV